ncbi:MAG TPA: M13 family metallopeptidase N-terminal domain-containing protein, partial [Candidatus Limnocylindrales bacterium]|nr:M13 family metallopeptidase N-terminal domain-containing protein [Candidatus Limnocylindrales bacterium]
MKSSHRIHASLALACVVLPLLFLAAQQPAAQPKTHGIAVNNMDKSVAPGDDFYDYANGGFLKRTQIPPDRPNVGVFSQLSDISNKRTADLIQEMAKSKAAPGSSAQQIADLYNSFLDEATIEARGLAPLKPHLDAINSVKDTKELSRALGETLRADVDALNNTNFHTPNLFGLWTAPGFADSDHYTAYFMQGGLELPNREYYLGDSRHMKEVREGYQKHIAEMFKLAGIGDGEARAARIVELEHSIAEKHWSLADNNDIHKANNPWKKADFAAKAPGLDWAEYFLAAGLDKQEELTVWQPSAIIAESALVGSVPLETWKDWLTYHLIEDYSNVLPKALA